MLVFGGHTIINDDGSSEHVALDADNLGGSLIVVWEKGSWKDAFHADCPDCTFVGKEPTKVEGGPHKFIALEKKSETEKVYQVALLSNAGEATLRMGKAWANVNI